MIRIANGQGFWGDSLEAPLEQMRRGPIEYLTLDYLAEVTMSILQKQRARDPRMGFAYDFLGVVSRGARDIVERNIKIVANAGGVNPEACCAGVAMALHKAGFGGRVKLGMVTGDDILERLDELIEQGIELRNIETGEPLTTIRPRVLSANAYLGAFPIAEAQRQGAGIVVTGRCADAALSLGPTIFEFGWHSGDWDKLAAGLVAGHVVECGAQCTGGNSQVDWESISDYEDIGYPIIEAEPGGSFEITKHAGTGGRVTVAGVTEQLLYEIGDPRCYVSPDCVADFTTIRLEQSGTDRVRFSEIKGQPATESYKVSISYSAGFKAVGALVYGWPGAYRKAHAADEILRGRLERLGLKFDAIHSEILGADALCPDSGQAVLRVGVRSMDRAIVERFTKELAPLALNGPPVVTGFGSGRPKVEEIVAYWPALIPKMAVHPRVTLQQA